MEPVTLFNEFLQRISYPDAPDVAVGGKVQLVFDSSTITFTIEPEAIRILSPFGDLEEGDIERKTHLEKLLKRSLALAENECICLNPETNQLCLTLRIATIDQNPANFESAVETFLNKLDTWAGYERVLQTERNQTFPGMFLR